MVPSSVRAIKLAIVVAVAAAFFIIAFPPGQTSVSASSKDPVDEISTYKTWTKLTPEPVQGDSLKTLANLSVASTDAGGWISYVFVTGPVRNDPDLVTLITRAGKGFGKLFNSRKEKPADTPPSPDHGFSYGMVYGNKLAASVVESSAKVFPVGSILIRERLDTRTATVPTVVIAMAKRERGFSQATGDWEFFMFNGTDMKLVSRETTGNCASCHARTLESDWVFLDHLKK